MDAHVAHMVIWAHEGPHDHEPVLMERCSNGSEHRLASAETLICETSGFEMHMQRLSCVNM